MKAYTKNSFTTILFFLLSCSLWSQNQPWVNLGPIPFPKTVVGQIHGIGRVSQIKFHPTDASKMYAASASGGLWYSANKGVSWTNLGTDLISDLQSASIAIDPSNDQILYWGTGDANYYSSGQGVYKSTNGGSTWALSNSGMGNRLVTDIIISPTNTQTLIAATNNGIYKSTNAGSTWVIKSATGIDFMDIVFKPGSNGQTIYASAGKGFYRSIDAGESWTKISSSAFVFGNNGTRVCVTAANPNLVYVANTGLNCNGEVYSSSDGGTTFKNVRSEKSNFLAAYTASNADGWNGQGNYNFDIFADQVYPNTLYLCGHIIWKSNDGGVTWMQQQKSWAYNLHTDQHHILKNPYNNTELWNANDGGVWSSTTEGIGAWKPMCDGIAATEIYHGNASNISNNIGYIGTQDNGGFYYANGIWTNNQGGDDTRTSYFDFANNAAYYNEGTNRISYPSTSNQALNLPFTPSKAIYSFTPANKNIGYVIEGGIVYRSSNIAATSGLAWTKIFTIPSGSVSDIETDPGNANVVYIVTNNQKAYRSDNASTSNPTFTTLTLPATNGTESHIAPIKNTTIVYIATNSYLYRSTDKGLTWTNVSAGFPTSTIKGLVADKNSSIEAIYAAYNLGVYYKDNTKSTWASYANGLPIIANISELYGFNDATSGLIRVSTYGRGVWEAKMKQLSSNVLPLVSITSPANNTTYVAPSTVIITATASDQDGNITKVTFYSNGIAIGTAVNSPYTFTWSTVAEGNYTLTAVATDDKGGTQTSASISISIAPDQTCSIASKALKYGSTPAYQNGTATYSKAFDGNVSTFFDYANPTGGYTALSFGANKSAKVNKVRFYPRSGQEGRMVGGKFQGSNDSLFSTGIVDLYTITTQPTSLTWSEGIITSLSSFKFLRYLSPINGYCNVNEIQFCGSIITNNMFPITSITAPLQNTTLTAPASVTIHATASDTDGTITNVAFYAGATLIATDFTSPYTTDWTSVPAGTYLLTCKATDNNGNVSTSSNITIKINNPNLSPTVSILTPVNHKIVSVGSDVQINTNATDTDGSITKVAFYNGPNLLTTVTNSPFNYVLKNIRQGTYTLTAVSTDNYGAETTSSSITIQAKRSAVSIINSPTQNQVSPMGTNLTLSLNTYDPDQIISKAAYYDGENLIILSTTTPYSGEISTLPFGDHHISAKITDQTDSIKTIKPNLVIIMMTDCNDNAWSNNLTYTIGSQVESNGQVYRAITNNQNSPPTDTSGEWQLLGKCAILTAGENTNLHRQVNIYPNPSSTGNFHLELIKLIDKEISYQVLDQHGNTLLQQNLGKITSDHYEQFISSHLASGMYFVKLRIGDDIITKKISVVSVPKIMK
ncbi:MAG: hypothetical protein RL060_1360 [Bacteroidota bacterium]|jgi:photosystem II stability/assembly factor-like uncharacterized protein